MQTIEIHPSRTADRLLVLLVLTVPFALWWAGLSGWWLGAVAWIVALWWAWRGTFGLGAGPLTLQYRPASGWEIQSAEHTWESLIRIRPVVVGPRLVIAELETERRHYSLVIPADAGSPEDLRRLRQLLLSGLARSDPTGDELQSEGRGT